MKSKPQIVGAGDVECSLCKPGAEPKDGLALDVNGVEQQFCWNHLKSMSRMWRKEWMQKEPETHLVQNGHS